MTKRLPQVICLFPPPCSVTPVKEVTESQTRSFETSSCQELMSFFILILFFYFPLNFMQFAMTIVQLNVYSAMLYLLLIGNKYCLVFSCIFLFISMNHFFFSIFKKLYYAIYIKFLRAYRQVSLPFFFTLFFFEMLQGADRLI